MQGHRNFKNDNMQIVEGEQTSKILASHRVFPHSLPPVSPTTPEIMGFSINSTFYFAQGAQQFSETQ